jgi:hypothetical protein
MKLLLYWRLSCCSPAVSSVVQGYLPALLLAAVLYVVPSIFFFLSRLEGHPSVSHQERKAATKMFTLLAGNVFLVGILGGSLISISETFSDDPKGIPRRLAEKVPSQVREHPHFKCMHAKIHITSNACMQNFKCMDGSEYVRI